MQPDRSFLLTLSDGRIIRYFPYISKMVWDGSDEPIHPDLVHNAALADQYRKFFAVSPETPGIKKNITTVKLQLGLKCNFACTYCNQASQPHEVHGAKSDIQPTLDRLQRVLGESDGTGFRIEFWGGEPFVYWRVLEPLGKQIRKRYPKADILIISNGSLIDEEKIRFLEENSVNIGISHDGPGFKVSRVSKTPGEQNDPLEDPVQLHWLREAYQRLGPSGTNRMSFNCVLTRHNYSLSDIRQHIAKRLGIPPGALNLVTEEMVTPYDAKGVIDSPHGENHLAILRNFYKEYQTGELGFVSSIMSKLSEFYNSLAKSRPASALGQKCGMDREDTLAMNMKGNVMTCHNTSPGTRHEIGHADRLEDVRLTSSWHFSHREECVRCPVVQLCKGSCMYNENHMWKQACDNDFYWNLGILAVFIYRMTNAHLVSVSGEVIRRESEPTTIPVIEV